MAPFGTLKYDFQSLAPLQGLLSRCLIFSIFVAGLQQERQGT
jgi:hypothetical protein